MILWAVREIKLASGVEHLDGRCYNAAFGGFVLVRPGLATSPACDARGNCPWILKEPDLTMIPELKDDELINRFGGRFKLTSVIQKRWRQLLRGARPMVEPEGLTELEVVVKELVEGKVVIDESPPEEEGSEQA